VLSIWGFGGGSGPTGLIPESGYTPCQVRGGSLGVCHGALGYEFGGRGAGGARPDNQKFLPWDSLAPGPRVWRQDRSRVCGCASSCQWRRGCVPRGHGGFFRWSSDVGTSVCVGNAVMPDTVVAVGAAVGRGELHGGGQVDVVVVGGRSTSVECPSLEARDGGGGVGPRRRLRTVRSNGVPGPRDSPVSEGRARLSELSIQQIGATGRVCGGEEVSPLPVGPTSVGCGRGGADVLRTSLEVRVSVLPSWGLRGARRNRSRILRAARRAACMRSAWPASLRCSCCRTLCRPFGGGGIR
jgi:hypothetical protein